MEIKIIQILAVLFGLFALSRSILRFKDGEVTWKELALWSVIWIGVIVVGLMPDITFDISRLLGIKRGIDAAVYGGIVVLFYLMFRMYVKIESLEHDITKAVRNTALAKGGKRKR